MPANPTQSCISDKGKQTAKIGSSFVAGLAESQTIIHVTGNGKQFIQAVIGPVQSVPIGNTQVTCLGKNITHLLIERCNGQLLAMQLLDQAERCFDLTSFMSRIEKYIPRFLDNKTNRQAIEARIDQEMKFKVLLAETAISSSTLNAIGAAIPVLAAAQPFRISGPQRLLRTTSDLVSSERIQQQLKIQLEVAIQQFIAGLDQRICSTIVRAGTEIFTSQYNCYRRCNEEKRNTRLQAADIFPLIGGLLADIQLRKGLRQAVDLKLPLVPALAKYLNVPAEVVRWLRGKDISMVGIAWVDRLNELASYLAELCPEHRPESPQDWEAFNSFLLAVQAHQANPHLRKQSPLPQPQLKWFHEFGRTGWHKARVRIQNLGATFDDLTDIPDFVAEIQEVLAHDVGGDSMLEEIMLSVPDTQVEDLFYSTGVFRQLRASLQWHQAIHLPTQITQDALLTASEPTLTLAAPDSWLAAFDGAHCYQDLVAVCLTNPRQLYLEGKHLKHCVGNYTDRCLYHGCTIVSFRDQTGRSVSTAELILDDNDLIFTVKQHKGLRNSLPPGKSVAALKEIISMLNSPEFQGKREMLKQCKNERRASRRTKPSAHADPERVRKLQEALQLHIRYEEFRLNAILKYGEFH